MVNKKPRAQVSAQAPEGLGSDAPIVSNALEINDETRWKARVFTRATRGGSVDAFASDELLLMLNKLTPSNFDQVVSRFLSSTNTANDPYNGSKNIAKAIAARAADDARYTAMYASLCNHLAETPPSRNKIGHDDGGWHPFITSCSVEGVPRNFFREIIFGHCRDELGRDPIKSGEPTDLEHPEEKAMRVFLARRRYVGIGRFVGELYNFDVVCNLSVINVVEELLGGAIFLSSSVDGLRLEGLCAVLEACGRKLEQESTLDTMNYCWDTLEGLVRTTGPNANVPRLNSRLRFMIMDLLDLRSDDWKHPAKRCQRQKELVARTLDQVRSDGQTTADQNLNDIRRRQTRRKGKKKQGKKVRF